MNYSPEQTKTDLDITDGAGLMGGSVRNITTGVMHTSAIATKITEGSIQCKTTADYTAFTNTIVTIHYAK